MVRQTKPFRTTVMRVPINFRVFVAKEAKKMNIEPADYLHGYIIGLEAAREVMKHEK